jgi:hypothetical protein
LYALNEDQRTWKEMGKINLKEDRLYTKYQKLKTFGKGVIGTSIAANPLVGGVLLGQAPQLGFDAFDLIMGDEYLRAKDKKLFTAEPRIATRSVGNKTIQFKQADVPFQMLIAKLNFPSIWSTPQSIFIQGTFKDVIVGNDVQKAQVESVQIQNVTLIQDEKANKTYKNTCIDNNNCIYFKPITNK